MDPVFYQLCCSLIAQEMPELQGESDELPDWISGLSYTSSSDDMGSFLCAGSYDGCLRMYQHKQTDTKDMEELIAVKNSTMKAHKGAIKFITAIKDDATDKILVASGSMDHTLVVHNYNPSSRQFSLSKKCQQGHTSAIGCLDIFPTSDQKLLASGDWDGTLCLWDLSAEDENADSSNQQQSTKKIKTGAQSSSDSSGTVIAPHAVLRQAHNSPISGVSWGNYQKRQAPHNTLVTGSWDHSVKVWDTERQECVLSLNGSRVVACLDTSHHSEGIVATGHPDCTIRLWDVRTTTDHTSTVSDKTFRPSHKSWITAVQWSPCNPYHLASTSHDGTVKVWDIRSSIPLHTVRVFDKDIKGLCMAYATNAKDDNKKALLFVGGTDCVVRHFTTNG
jgi:ribosome biogenesis protein YTM1